MNTHQEQIMQRNRGSMFLAMLLLAVQPASARPQEEHLGFSGDRGDVHSKGWDAAMQLKGEPVEPKFARLGAEIERFELDNGLVIYLAEDHRLPLIDLQLIFRGGELYEDESVRGAAGFAGEQMSAGGTSKLSADELEDRLAFLAARISTSIGEETGRAGLNVLARDFDEGLALLTQVLFEPAFDPERFELSKRSRLFRLRFQNDNPGQVLRREFNALVYGEDHPRGRRDTPEMVEKIDRDMLIAAHDRFVRPNHAFLAAVGDFDSKEMLAKLEGAFGGWERGEDLDRVEIETDLTPRPGVYLVDRPVNQSSIAIGHLGVDRENPDRFAIALMNDVLGGGSFSSRVTERVRSDEGLAYSAGTRFDTSGREIGLFQASVQTKTETTAQAIASILDEIRKIQGGGTISRNEFETARESVLYSYVFRFEDLSRNVSRLMQHELEGRPIDIDRQEFEGYRRATPADLEKAAAKYLRPEQLTIFVVGDAAEIEESLEQFGPVTRVELEDDGGKRRGGRRGR